MGSSSGNQTTISASAKVLAGGTVPDSGTSSTQVILQDMGSQKSINSDLNIANNALVTGTATFLKSGLYQIQPDGNHY
jgi:hypothetical protein